MSKIYIEVPKTTDMITASVPCGKEEDYLWQFRHDSYLAIHPFV